ncbi:MAG: hypothetical protein LC655_03505 [Bacteroidales bacterium]|nr:hypothetical protein [Bacteroidales bacterium]
MMKKIIGRLKRLSYVRRHDFNYDPEKGREFAEKARKGIEQGMGKLGSEATETKEMARSFFRLLEHKLNMHERTVPPTEEEVLEAIEQLKDVGRLSVFTTAVILPGGVFSLWGLELLARKFGIEFTFFPSSFRKNAGWKYPSGQKKKRKSSLNSRKKDISDVKPVDEDSEKG